jgi:O-antigen/teichoic acid export membrane protein
MPTQARKADPARNPGGRVFAALRNPLYRSSYALIANTAGTTAVGIVYWAVAAHLYGRQTLGRSSALISALILLSSFAQLNLVNTLPRFLPQAGRSSGKFIAYSYGASSFAALISGVGFVTILPRLSSQWQFLAGSLSLSVTFAAATVVWGVFALQDFVLLSLRRPVVVPVENFVYGICKLLMLVGVALLLPSSGIFFSWVVPLVITVPAVNWLIFRRYLKDRDQLAAPSMLRAREIVRFASVDYLGTVLSQASGNLLPLLVLSTLGAAANGSFYIAWTIASGLGLAALNFAASLLVEGAAAPHRLAELTRGILARSLAVTSLGAALLILAAHPILDIYGPGYAAHAARLLGLLSVGTIPSCFVVVALSLDRIAGRVGRATLTRLVLTVLVLGGSWLLLKRVGVDGVAFSWGSANLAVALVRSPTIFGAVRRGAVPTSALSAVGMPQIEPPPQVGTRSHRPGIHRRPAGRHRVGTHPVRRQHARPVPDTSAMPIALEPAGQTAQALRLLMSLGTEVYRAPANVTAPSSSVLPRQSPTHEGSTQSGFGKVSQDGSEVGRQEDLFHQHSGRRRMD